MTAIPCGICHSETYTALPDNASFEELMAAMEDHYLSEHPDHIRQEGDWVIMDNEDQSGNGI